MALLLCTGSLNLSEIVLAQTWLHEMRDLWLKASADQDGVVHHGGEQRHVQQPIPVGSSLPLGLAGAATTP
jgi:hypothetical protein